MDTRGIRSLLDPLARRVAMMVARCVVKMTSDAPAMQEVQASLLEGELRDGMERFQNYGFTSHPHPGAEGVAVFVGGGRDHGLVIAVDDRRYRIKSMKQGEVAIYTDEGDSIHLKRDRCIEVTTLNMLVNAPESYTVRTGAYTVEASQGISYRTTGLTMQGIEGGAATAQITGGLNVTEDVQAGAISLRSHTHPETNGAATLQPTGG